MPLTQPGALPPVGGWTLSAGRPTRSNNHEITELEFHMSPIPSSSRPHRCEGTRGLSEGGEGEGKGRKVRPVTGANQQSLRVQNYTLVICRNKGAKIGAGKRRVRKPALDSEVAGQQRPSQKERALLLLQQLDE